MFGDLSASQSERRQSEVLHSEAVEPPQFKINISNSDLNESFL